MSSDEKIAELEAERDAARAQLAEAVALLREVSPRDWEHSKCWVGKSEARNVYLKLEWWDRRDAFLEEREAREADRG